MFEILCAVLTVTVIGLTWQIWRPILRWAGIGGAILAAIGIMAWGGAEIYDVAKERLRHKPVAEIHQTSAAGKLSKRELLFEAERRGLLTAQKLALVQEARRRGLVSVLKAEGPAEYRLLSNADLMAALERSEEAGPWQKYRNEASSARDTSAGSEPAARVD
jgi:hypothetical protein